MRKVYGLTYLTFDQKCMIGRILRLILNITPAASEKALQLNDTNNYASIRLC